VLNQARKILMVLRSYQFHAVEALIHRVENSRKNGYIWHTTGSGKTLTSFKASQILTRNPKIDKVVFVVDRKDLDYQTQKEFDAFSKGSVDATSNTRMLVKQFGDNTRPLILTTIQKLNNTIENYRYLEKMQPQRDREIIFIFDECHRGQFGETHKRIKTFFSNARMFGFTGTPIFAENAVTSALGKRTTKELFDRCLHKYVITDAIRDENVLKFAIEYIGKYKEKEGGKTEIDIEVEDIDTKELLESPGRLGKITDYILANHDRKTHAREFTAMFCVSSIETLITFYQLFKEREKQGAHNLKIAAIFSYTANEEDRDAYGIYDYPWQAENGNLLKIASPVVPYGDNPESAERILTLPPSPTSHSRDQLEAFMGDYNAMFNTKFTTRDSQSFYNYCQDLGRRVKNRQIDILLVVNMFLTGFDCTTLNTLYVDKNLKYHGLIQAYSRTNRILNDKKSHGNIVCFRNLKKAADDAITLFANKNAQELIIMAPYEDYVQRFNKAFAELLTITPTVAGVDDLKDEGQELEFIKAFRDLMCLKNQLSTFVDFTWENLDMEEQAFEDYKSKYLDLYEKVKNGTGKEKVSILEDVDFELELIHRDEINVQYILVLLARLVETPGPGREAVEKQVSQLLAGQFTLRSKRKLIEKFIEENLVRIADSEDIPDRFQRFWTIEKNRAFTAICTEENLSVEKCRAILDKYLYTSREPLRDDVLDMLLGKKPGVRERKPLAQRIIAKLTGFVETFINGIDF
jgi:type I restriction enzyme, R subunit